MTPTPTPSPPYPALVVYDGECQLCQRSARRLARLDRRGRFDLAPLQTPGLVERYPALARTDLQTGLRLLVPCPPAGPAPTRAAPASPGASDAAPSANATVHVGADAVYQICRRLPPLHLVAWLYRIRPLQSLFRAAYALLARHRFRLFGRAHCEAGVCTLPPGRSPQEPA